MVRRLRDTQEPVYDAHLKRERPLQWRDVLVLARFRTDFALYVRAFREAGIPFLPPGRGMLAASREVRDLVRDHAETVAWGGDVGAHVGPGQHDRTAFPRFADEFVIPFVQHALRIHVVALHAERLRVHQQLRPAVQALASEFEQRQAAQHRQAQALDLVEAQALQRGDRLVAEEFGGQQAQAVLTVGLEAA